MWGKLCYFNELWRFSETSVRTVAATTCRHLRHNPFVMSVCVPDTIQLEDVSLLVKQRLCTKLPIVSPEIIRSHSQHGNLF